MRVLLTDRNKQLVQMLDSGEFTLQQVGKHFGISRQRAAQIYGKYTGGGYRIRMENKIIQRIQEREEKARTPRYFCKYCSEAVFSSDRFRYCSARCFRAYHNYNRKTTLTCTECGGEYYPWRASFYAKKKGIFGNFCSLDHYILFKKKGSIKYGTYERQIPVPSA